MYTIKVGTVRDELLLPAMLCVKEKGATVDAPHASDISTRVVKLNNKPITAYGVTRDYATIAFTITVVPAREGDYINRGKREHVLLRKQPEDHLSKLHGERVYVAPRRMLQRAWDIEVKCTDYTFETDFNDRCKWMILDFKTYMHTVIERFTHAVFETSQWENGTNTLDMMLELIGDAHTDDENSQDTLVIAVVRELRRRMDVGYAGTSYVHSIQPVQNRDAVLKHIRAMTDAIDVRDWPAAHKAMYDTSNTMADLHVITDKRVGYPDNACTITVYS